MKNNWLFVMFLGLALPMPLQAQTCEGRQATIIGGRR